MTNRPRAHSPDSTHRLSDAQVDHTQSAGQVRAGLIAAAAVIALPAIWILVVYGLPLVTDDTPVHWMRLFVLDRHLRGGDLLPRWAPELYTGYGYPLFNFYAPAMYYLAEWLHLAGLSLLDSLRATYALAMLAGAVGAAFLGADMYATDRDNQTPLRRHEKRRQRAIASPTLPASTPSAFPPPHPAFWPGLLAAAAYIYAPYLLINLYVRGAFGEAGALALLPWVFWTFQRLFRTQRTAATLVLAGMLLALLVAVHTITFVLTLPALLLYVGVLASATRAGERWPPILASGVSLLLAALLSAVIWLPQLLERSSLSDAAYTSTRLLANLWRWEDFLTLPGRVRASEGGQPPYQLGALQAGLLLLGFLLTRRRTRIWWFWVAVTGAGIFLLSPLAAPFWELTNLFAIVQFPWRLLGLLSLSSALIGAGVATAFPTSRARAIGVSLLLVLIVITQMPRVSETPNVLPTHSLALSLASVNRAEAAMPALGAGYDDEFLPRWAEPGRLAAPAGEPTELQIHSARLAADSLALEYTAPATFPLSVRQFYFPGWYSKVADAPATAMTPAPASGLATSLAPAGSHTIVVGRNATDVQHAGLALSLLGVLLASIGLLLQRWRTGLSVGALSLLVALVGLIGMRTTPSLMQAPVITFPMPVVEGLDLLDLRTSHAAHGRLLIEPTWFVQHVQPDLLEHWRLVDSAGVTIAEIRSRPRFGLWTTNAWSPGQIVTDAVEIGRPYGTPAGIYQLHLALVDEQSGETLFSDQAVQTVHLPAMPALDTPARALVDFRSLTGERIAQLRETQISFDDTALPAGVQPGALVDVALAWDLDIPTPYPYQSFVQITNHLQQKVASYDLQIGTREEILDLITPYLTAAERITLRLPESLESGLYTVQVGLRDRRTGDRLIAVTQDGATLGDLFTAATFKVRTEPGSRPAEKLPAQFGDMIVLEGFTRTPTAAVHPGDTLTVTLHYAARTAMNTDYTRFLQLHSPAHGMAAQADAMPQNGANPTSTWIKGERVADTAVLHIAPDAAPGTYQLLLGFYDPANGGARLPAYDKKGKPLTDQAVVLQEITVAP